MTKDIHHYFIPSLRQGLSAAINRPAAAHRAGIDIKLTAVARRKVTRDWDPEPLDVEKVLQLYGPGDILGFDDRIVARRHPEPDVGDFEPNYFPSIEFTDADFAWRFTADRAEYKTGKLRPWITLAVLVSSGPGDLGPEFVELPRSDRRLPPQIAVSTAALPDLQYSWRWAHAHIIEEAGKERQQLEQNMREEPEVAICRLLCARRLAPKTRYTAFVLPTFKLGVLAGLGLDLKPKVNEVNSGPAVNALDKAWYLDDTIDKKLRYHVGERPPDWPESLQQLEEGKVLRLPYYYRWDFGTGLRGDFEHLVRLLEPRKLGGLGIRDIDCSAPGLGVPGVNREVQSQTDNESETGKHFLGMEGALRSLDTQYTRWGRDPVYTVTESAHEPAPLQTALAELLNEPKADQALPDFTFEAFDTAEIEEIAVRLHPNGTSATISWRTNQPAANSGVKYGKNTACDLGNAACTNCPDGVHQHRVILAQLAPGTRYYFKVVAQTQTGVGHETPAYSFEMPPLPSVVPPIYGRWHSGRDGVVAEGQEQWLDVLNLDPRHRAAAGLGSEVVRKQQESLMASAWDQLGAIESVNDILRRGQFGRDTSIKLYERVGQLDTEDFLRVTSPVLKRVITEEPDSGRRTTATQYLKTQSRIPEAAFDPAFRRIIRSRGPIRKRQPSVPGKGLLNRLASGSVAATRFGPSKALKPAGTVTLCDITRRMAKPTVTLKADPGGVGVGETTTLTWSSTNTEACRVSTGATGCSGSDELTPFVSGGGGGGGTTDSVTDDSGNSSGGLDLVSKLYTINCTGSLGSATATVEVTKRTNPVRGGGEGVPVTETGVGSVPDEASSRNFCEAFFNCENVRQALTDRAPFHGVTGAPDPDAMANAVCDTLNNWLDKALDPAEEQPPIQDDAERFLEDLRKDVQSALDPNLTVLERTKNRLQLAGDLAQRFEDGATGDPLDPIMWAPEFPQPMYEPLRDISHQLLLPGVEKVPQNTLGLLQTNRRFLESYHCGLNHELAGEFLWRGFQTDQQGSYFRQFWDVSEFIPESSKRLGWLLYWIKRKTGQISTETDETDENVIISAVPRPERERLLWRHADWTREQLEELWKTQSLQGDEEEKEKEQSRRNRILSGINGGRMSVLSSLTEDEFNVHGLASKLAIEEQIDEELKDVQRLTNWKRNKLGDNAMRPVEDLVLVVRGDLLKRYPNAVIYAVDAVPCDGNGGELVPALLEYLKGVDGSSIDDDERVNTILEGRKRVFPVFRATLPPDMTFFGFPFSDEEARGTDGDGKYFVIEEQLAEPRFGLDVPEETPTLIKIWPDDLCWSHFGTEDGSFDFGRFLDNPPDGDLPNLQLADPPADPGEPEIDAREKWQNASAAGLARITCQDPVRIAVHAKQMLRIVASYFELKGSDSDDRFVIKLVHPDKIQHARNILDGEVTERLRIKGIVVSKPAAYNPDWSYHLDPDSITFGDSGMEAYDATMRHVEDNLSDLGDLLLPDGIWCPSDAVLVQERKES